MRLPVRSSTQVPDAPAAPQQPRIVLLAQWATCTAPTRGLSRRARTVHIMATADPSAALVEQLYRRHINNPDTLAHIAANADLPASAISSLLVHPNPRVRAEAHSNPAAAQAALAASVSDPDWRVRACALRNPAMPEAVREQFTVDRDENVRASLAAWQFTPAQTIALFDIPNETVRVCEWLAHRHDLTSAAAYALVERDEQVVVEALASNSSLDGAVLTALWDRHNHLLEDPQQPDTFAVSLCNNSATDVATLQAIGSTYPQRHQLTGGVDRARRRLLDQQVAAMSGTQREHAELLLPTFTGWPDELAATVTVLTSPAPPRRITTTAAPGDPAGRGR